jgi:hypothetical protein
VHTYTAKRNATVTEILRVSTCHVSRFAVENPSLFLCALDHIILLYEYHMHAVRLCYSRFVWSRGFITIFLPHALQYDSPGLCLQKPGYKNFRRAVVRAYV